MKYLVLLGDGMADVPNPKIKGLTPIEVAKTPNIDNIAKKSQVGLLQSVPLDMNPGSDVANLSVLGYDPKKTYSGRSPLEAVAAGVKLEDSDVAVRTNLVCLSNDNWAEKRMLDYSSGAITTKEGVELIQSVQNQLGDDIYKFYPGVSYRHTLVIKHGTTKMDLTPPHDISSRKIAKYLPKGPNAEKMLSLIQDSEMILKNHPVNIERLKKGQLPATHIWFWGAGTKPHLQNFEEKYGLKGAIISAVDLLKGIAISAGMHAPYVKGATGTLCTNWQGKVDKAIELFEAGYNYVYLHMEAPDECGHQGNLEEKIAAIEKVDWVLGEMYSYLKSTKTPFTLALTPDHATPLDIKTHSHDPVPYLIYKSNEEIVTDIKYAEKDARNGKFLENGEEFMRVLLGEQN